MKQLFDPLKEDKKMVEANTPEELKQIVDQDIAYLEGTSFAPYDTTRQALNKRLIDLTQLPIDIGKGTQSYIKKPEFIFPINEMEVAIDQLYLLTDNFKIIGNLRDTHKSSIWQMAFDSEFKNLAWERESLIFKTTIQIPEIVKKTLIYGKEYYFRVKYKGKKYESAWSDVIKISIQKVIIEKPYFYFPSNESIIIDKLKLITSPFKAQPINGSKHQTTLWEMSEDELFQEKIWVEESNIFLTEITVPEVNILPGRTYYLKFQYIDDYNTKSSFSEVLKVYSKYKVEKPIIINPINESTLSRRELNIKGSEFKTFPYSNRIMKSYEIEISTDLNFDNKVISIKNESNKCEFLVPFNKLDFDTVYHVRIKYYGEVEESEWSDPISIRTDKVHIETPVILSPIEDSIVSAVLFNINCSDFTTTPTEDDTHVRTTYEISKNIQFNEKVYETTTTEHLSFISLSKPHLFINTNKVFIRVKYIGLKGESDWSEVREINMFTAAIPVTPILERRLKTSENFGSDQIKNIGRLITDVVLNDSYDQIVWSKWIFGTDVALATKREERIISNNPKVFPLNEIDSYFEDNQLYFVKVAFKTLSTSEEKFSDVGQFYFGGYLKPSITEYELINIIPSHHELTFKCSPIEGNHDYNEYNKYAALEISNKSNFSTLLATIPNESQTVDFATGHVSYLHGNLYIRWRYTGYYFGTTPYSDTLVLNLGEIQRPNILSHEIQYLELSETVMETYVTLKSSVAVYPENRKDNHIYTKWVLDKNNYVNDIISEIFTYELTTKKIKIDLNTIQHCYGFVKYYSQYFPESEFSTPYEITLNPFIFTPVILKPIENEILLKENVVIEVKPYRSVPSINHTSTHWKITSDIEGSDIVWQNDSVIDKLSITVPPDSINYGEKYYLHVTFKSDNNVSKTKTISFETKAVGSLNVKILPSDVINDGAQWRIVGTDTWYSNDTTLENMVIGNYQIEYKNLMPKWKELPIRDIIINKNQLTSIEETYETNGGTLQIIIIPEPAVVGGCKFRRVNTDEWLESGVPEVGLLSGVYEVEFLSPDLDKFIPPNNMEILINTGETTAKEAEFLLVEQPGVSLEEVKINKTVILSGKKRIPPKTVTADIINGEGVVEPLSKTIPYMTSTTFNVVGGFKIKDNNESIIESTTIP